MAVAVQQDLEAPQMMNIKELGRNWMISTGLFLYMVVCCWLLVVWNTANR